MKHIQTNHLIKYYNIIPGYIYKDITRKCIHPYAPGPSGGIGIFIRCDLMDGIDVDSTDESFAWLRLRSSFFSCIFLASRLFKYSPYQY